MDTANKLLQIVRRVRSANAARDRDLEEIEKVLEKIQVPGEQRKRQNLKQERIDGFERAYATGTWRKPQGLKKGSHQKK